MKHLLTFIISILTITAWSQVHTDTIITKSGRQIICTITLVNDTRVFYTHTPKKKPISEHMLLSEVQQHTGVSETVNYSESRIAPLSATFVTDLPVSPGDQLIKFANTYYVGVSASIVGIGISTAGIFSEQQEVTYLGIGVSVIGFLVTIYSFSRIAQAGRIMNEKGIGVASNGVGISYKF